MANGCTLLGGFLSSQGPADGRVSAKSYPAPPAVWFLVAELLGFASVSFHSEVKPLAIELLVFL